MAIKTQTFTGATEAVQALVAAGFSPECGGEPKSQYKRWANGARVAILDAVLLSRTAQRAVGGRWGWEIRELAA